MPQTAISVHAFSFELCTNGTLDQYVKGKSSMKNDNVASVANEGDGDVNNKI